MDPAGHLAACRELFGRRVVRPFGRPLVGLVCVATLSIARPAGASERKIDAYAGGPGVVREVNSNTSPRAVTSGPEGDHAAAPSNYAINKQGYDRGEQRLLDRAATLDAESGARLRDYANAHKEFREAAMKAVQKVIDRGDDPLKLSQLAVPWESDGRKETMLGPAAIKQAYEYLKANGAR